MRKKMNAFTLIELLAVIVILAIIALIATPIILGIVEDAKKDAFLRSVELVISTTDIDIANKTFEEEYTYEITDGNISNLEVSVKNTDGMNGSITYDVNGKEVYAIHNGVYCVKKTNTMNRPEISDYKGTCSLMTSEKCFKFSNGTITDYYNHEENDSSKPECSRDVRIPETINGVTVTSIGESAFKSKNVTSVKFSASITSIGAFAFQYNKLWGGLDLSNTSITNLGDYAFNGKDDGSTNQIISVKFPNTLKYLGSSAFAGNRLTGELDLSNTNLVSIRTGTFQGTSNGSTNQITSVKFPSSLKSIENVAFRYNKLSGELDLSNTQITSIGWNAFEGSYDGNSNQITSIKFPNSLMSIEKDAFRYNKISGELDLSNTNLISIGEYAFGGNANGSGNQITSIKFPNSLTSIGRDVFQYNKLSGELDLSMYTNLKSISGFNSNGITSIKLPSSIESIGIWAFSENALSGELDLSMYTNLTSIQSDAFRGSSTGSTNQITSIKLPNSITNIGDSSFSNNAFTSELDLSMYTNLKSISGFNSNGITSIKLPSSIESIGTWAFSENALSGELDLSMYNNLTTIEYGAFRGKTDGSSNRITSVKFPNSVISIKGETFRYNALTSVTFYGRSDLTGVTVGSNAWGWASGYNADNNIYFVNE